MYGTFYDVMQNIECIVFERTSDTEQRILEASMCLFVNPVLILSPTNLRPRGVFIDERLAKGTFFCLFAFSIIS